MRVSLVPLNRMNWEPFSRIRISETQQKWVPGPLYCLAESAFEPALRLGITDSGEPKGMIILLHPGSPEPWISRFLIDLSTQRQGIGSEAMSQLLTTSFTSASRIRTSVSLENHPARAFFESFGFLFSEIPGDPEAIGILQR